MQTLLSQATCASATATAAALADADAASHAWDVITDAGATRVSAETPEQLSWGSRIDESQSTTANCAASDYVSDGRVIASSRSTAGCKYQRQVSNPHFASQ